MAVEEISNSLAWARAPAPPASQCAWCARCRVATTSPWPTPAQLDEAYGNWYRPAGGRFAGLGDAVLRRTRGALADRLHRILPPGPVLDVGAGDGTLVEAFVRHGRDAMGLEPYASGPNVRNAEVEEVDGN